MVVLLCQLVNLDVIIKVMYGCTSGSPLRWTLVICQAGFVICHVA